MSVTSGSCPVVVLSLILLLPSVVQLESLLCIEQDSQLLETNVTIDVACYQNSINVHVDHDRTKYTISQIEYQCNYGSNFTLENNMVWKVSNEEADIIIVPIALDELEEVRHCVVVGCLSQLGRLGYTYYHTPSHYCENDAKAESATPMMSSLKTVVVSTTTISSTYNMSLTTSTTIATTTATNTDLPNTSSTSTSTSGVIISTSAGTTAPSTEAISGSGTLELIISIAVAVVVVIIVLAVLIIILLCILRHSRGKAGQVEDTFPMPALDNKDDPIIRKVQKSLTIETMFEYLKDGELKDGEPKDDEPKDGEPKDDEPKDGESKDDEPKDDDTDVELLSVDSKERESEYPMPIPDMERSVSPSDGYITLDKITEQ